MNNNRLLYIDKLKALAMLLVVWGHTMYFCMYHEQTGISDPLLNIICTFHVPLFFFLSGVVVSSAPYARKFLAKARRFMVPMLVVGLVNALVIGRVEDFFLDGGHNGYWYLLTLTLFYLLLMPFNLHNHTQSSPVADIGLSVAIWAALYLATGLHDPVSRALNIGGAFQFWPFFVLGFLSRKYSLLRYVTGRPCLTASLVMAYTVLLIASFSHIGNMPFILFYSLAILAIAALVALFFHFSDSNTFIDRQLLLIGNSTLGIYVFHYFFIRFINLDFLRAQGLAAELTVTAILTIVISYASMLIGRLLRRTPIFFAVLAALTMAIPFSAQTAVSLSDVRLAGL